MSDKKIELERYEKLAANILANDSCEINFLHGSSALSRYLATPYIYFEEIIRNNIRSEVYVLEIGSGTGFHTGSLLKAGGTVVASDISATSLMVLRNRYKEYKNLKLIVSDMEYLPFRNESCDVVISAGSLSYGDPKLVMREVHRVLRHQGIFICIDSLSHNPIYRLNRWIHYLRGKRSKSTLSRMPKLDLLKNYA